MSKLTNKGICPYCNIEMIRGYLNTCATIWSENSHLISLLPGRNEKYALKLGTPLFSAHTIESDFCTQCKRIIIDASKYKNNY